MKKSTIVSTFIALVALACNTNVNAQRVTVTLAGDGIAGFAGDGGSSKLAQVSGPKDICMDAAQNIYFVDKANDRIRKVSAQKGVISTVAGGGSSLADGVSAISASLTPNYMCVSASGNLYFTTDNRIRKVDAVTGLVSTIAGTTASGYTGDGALAVAATLNTPEGICLDAANNIYVVDRGNNCVRKIDAATGFIQTLAGNGTPGLTGDGLPATAALLHGPVCVAVDAAGDVFYSDQNPTYPGYDNSIIREIDITTGLVSSIAGATPGGTTFGVPAMVATLGTITGLCVGPDDDVYCNEMSCSCRRMHHHHHVDDSLYLVGGNFYSQGYNDDINSTLGDMNIPYGLCVDKMGNVFVADSNNQRIRKIISVSNTPAFAFGRGQYLDAVIGTPYVLDSMMWVTDLDSAQAETWTVLTAPMYGMLAGFPATATSNATSTTTKATGLSYTALPSYAGGDFFRIRITDATGLSDTVTVYVGPNSTSAPLSVGNTKVAAGINIFPNPATSVLNIVWTNLKTDNAQMVITDVAAREMYKTVLTGNNNGAGLKQVDISSLPAGTYFVNINGSEVKKFVKQ